MIGCHTARKPLLFMCLRGVNDYAYKALDAAALQQPVAAIK